VFSISVASSTVFVVMGLSHQYMFIP